MKRADCFDLDIILSEKSKTCEYQNLMISGRLVIRGKYVCVKVHARRYEGGGIRVSISDFFLKVYCMLELKVLAGAEVCQLSAD